MEKQSTLLLSITCMLILQICWFDLITSTSSMATITHHNNFTDQEALLTFKSHVTRDPNNTLSNSWNTNTSFCNWIGISCDRRKQRVSRLDLHDMGLEGTIPPHIANLTFLAILNLSNNNFHGHLPHELGRLRRLQAFDLLENKMEGMIPSSLANLTKLYNLVLSNNKLQGNIPADLGCLSNLTYLYLHNNSLSGEIPLSIFNISSLVQLVLSRNNFSGWLPADTGRFLPNLERFHIQGNHMSGSIPVSLSNASKLAELFLHKNNFNGNIPHTLGHLLHLELLSMGSNNFTGTIPSIFNLSHLTFFSVGFNQLSGPLPPDIGNWLPNIDALILHTNQLSGQIPLSLGNASKLTELEVAVNEFSGPVPATLGKLPLLRWLSLHTNRLTNEVGNNDLKFLTYFTNCKHLEELSISKNPISGSLPSSVGNLSALWEFSAIECGIEGTIPREFGNLSNLITLMLAGNDLHGTIPSTIGRLKMLQRLYLHVNRLEGSIPIELGHLHNLGDLYLSWNMFSGDIPDLFKNLSGLQTLDLSNNKLSAIPSSLWTLQDLLSLNLSYNSLRGILPQEVGNLKNLVSVDFSRNQFIGNIPISLGHLQMLQYLYLRSNSFEGPIPLTFGDLISMKFMDLSLNHLNGTIPKSLETLRYLEFLNLSFNRLEGEIPNGGVFANFTAQSFIGNSKLCSAPNMHIKLNVSLCHNHKMKSRVSSLEMKIVISIVAITSFVVCFCLWIIYHWKKEKNISPINDSPTREYEMISYQELLRATNNFSEANLIGVGSFGSVYKGTMVDGSLVAVKVFNIQSEGGWESFDAECEVMSTVRHRNLVKIITSCSSLDFRALILEFMPNGSLDQWLHSDKNYLNLLQRIEIMIDIAFAMEYLHHYFSTTVVHCDLKPSNVLLDEDFTAHVSDFGIAKILDEKMLATRTSTLGTIGYIAPEYGLVGKVSTKGDVYSYGILLLEMLTRKRPTDAMFIGGLSLRHWVNAAFPNAITDVVDMNLLSEIGSSKKVDDVDDPRGRQLSCILSIVEVSLSCSKDLAEERISMKDVVARLMKIKKEFLSI